MRRFESALAWIALSFLSASASAQAWIDAPRLLLGPGSDIRGIADVDGDGDEDLLAALRGPNNTFTGFQVHFSTGTDEYTAGAPTAVPNPTARSGGSILLLGDLTGDGLPELVFDPIYPEKGISFCLNVNGVLAAPVLIPVTGSLRSLVMADRDGDGILDLADHRLIGWQIPDEVRWWDWDGTTLVPGTITSLATNANWLRAADLSGEGRADLVAGSNYSSTVHVAVTLPDGELGPFTATSTIGAPSYGFEAYGGDLDGDGDEDLLALWSTNSDHRSLAVVDNLGGGALAAGTEHQFELLSFYDYQGPGYLADWDLDGDLDCLSSWQRLYMLENDGRGKFHLSESMPLPSQSPGAGVADLNEDGLPDFAGGRVILHGDGSLQKEPQSWIRGGLFRALDLEGDGDLDLVNTEEDTWTNDGTGAFHQLDHSIAPLAGSIFGDYTALGDLDGDGRPDLLVARHLDIYASFPFQDMRLLRGSITGTYQDAGLAAAPGVRVGSYFTFDVPPGDVDGDSDLDVLSTDGWWENDGTGFFTAFHAAWSGLPRAAADVDGDLDLDLVTYSYTLTFGYVDPTNSIHLQRNLGGGSFLPELLATEPVGSELSHSVLVADSDGDGDPEVALGTTDGPRVLFFDNAGGSYGSPLELPGQDSAQEVLAFSDVDGDGSLDVIGAPVGSLGATWLVWRRAGAGFDPPRAYFALPGILSGDVDQDGDVDVIGYGVVRSLRFHGPGHGSVRQYGRGTRGSGNATPVLGAVGPLRPGSPSAALRIARGRGGALAVVRAGTGPAHGALSSPLSPTLLIRGPFLHVPLVLGGAPGAPGEGSAELSLTPMTIALAGRELWLQALIVDPGARGGIATTNGLELVLGDVLGVRAKPRDRLR